MKVSSAALVNPVRSALVPYWLNHRGPNYPSLKKPINYKAPIDWGKPHVLIKNTLPPFRVHECIIRRDYTSLDDVLVFNHSIFSQIIRYRVPLSTGVAIYENCNVYVPEGTSVVDLSLATFVRSGIPCILFCGPNHIHTFIDQSRRYGPYNYKLKFNDAPGLVVLNTQLTENELRDAKATFKQATVAYLYSVDNWLTISKEDCLGDLDRTVTAHGTFKWLIRAIFYRHFNEKGIIDEIISYLE